MNSKHRFATIGFSLMFCFAVAAERGAIAQSSTTQSGSGTTQSGSTSQGSGSGSATSGSAVPQFPVAMNGYCAVCILDMRKWVKGDNRFAVVMDGKKYLFPGEAQMQQFLKNTTKYTPALSGNCVVAYATSGKIVPGSIYHTARHKDRLYMFPNEAAKAKFMQNPSAYEKVDLAFGGMCPVCRVEMKQEIPGKPEFGTILGGKRYYFPGQEQKMMFLGNKAKYAEK